MTATTPGIVWASVTAANAANTAAAYDWQNPTLMAGNPPAVTMPHGYVLKATAIVIGSASTVYPISVLVNAGSDNVQVTSGTTSDIEVGMVAVPTVQVAPPAGLPLGLQVMGVNQPVGGSIMLGSGGSGSTPLEPATAMVPYAQPASQTLSANLNLIDEYPTGQLAVTSSPSSGVTIQDYAFDGTGSADNVGNGSAMRNSGGQAMGTFTVAIANAGTYTLTVAHTNFDPNYGNAANSTLTVVAT